MFKTNLQNEIKWITAINISVQEKLTTQGYNRTYYSWAPVPVSLYCRIGE